MKNKIFFIVFIFIWIVLVVFNFIVPKVTFSEQENRYLAKIPSFSFEKLVSGEYQEDLDSYINDHFIFRNIWIKIKSQQEKLLGKTESNGVFIGKDGFLFEKFSYGTEEKANMENVANVVNKFVNNINGIGENVIVNNVENRSENNGESAVLSNIPVYFILVPNSIYINQDKLPDNAETPNQYEIITNFYKELDASVYKVNVTDTMTNNKDNYLYFKTDHHMTSNGAYLVYREFNNAKGISTLPLVSYEPQVVANDFLGTFDSKAQMVNQERDYIVSYRNENNTNLKEVIYDNEKTKSIYNEEYLSKKDKYSFFLNGNNARVVVKTNVINNKKLLVVKDSYAHIMVQFLCNDYEEIHLIDPRYYREALSNYVKENDIDEVLFLYNVSNLATDVGIRNVR